MTDSEIDAIYRKRELKASADKSLIFPAIWQEINSNVYTYKRRKSIKEEDIAICQCRPVDGKGCLENCINRILNIECTPGFCPCEGACRNQRFFRRQHADVEIRPADDKGFGLFAKALIHDGEFVTEYMGEILDEMEYLRRRTFYAESGHKHYYFMQIGNGEVIDACRMGNAGRFMNHSCDPNCETQKWLVKGDLRVGFFTTRSVQAGEELTFNYNFQTEKPIRCYCGSSNCTGSIGGQKTLSHTIRHTEEAPELLKEGRHPPPPIMVRGEDVDEVLESFLAQQVGVFDPTVSSNGDQIKQRLKELYKSHGYYNLAESLESEDLSKANFTPRGLTNDQPVSSSSGDLSEKQRSRDLISNRLVNRKRLRGRGGRSSCSSSSLERYPSSSILSGNKGTGTRSSKGTTLNKHSSTTRSRLDPDRRRSEVDLSLDDITAESGKLYNPSRRNIVKVLRLFNLIEIGKTEKERLEAEQERERRRSELEQSMKIPSGNLGVTTRTPSKPVFIGGYCIDPSMKEDALNVVLNTIDPTARGLFIEFGILSQLQQVIGRNFAPQYSVMLRKILKVVDCLPLKYSDFEKTRSSHGPMGHLIITLTYHKDNGVRNKALAIARQYNLVTESQLEESVQQNEALDRQISMQDSSGYYRPRIDTRRAPEALVKRPFHGAMHQQMNLYGQEFSSEGNAGYVQNQPPPPPPPPPPYPDHEKSQTQESDGFGLDATGGSLSLPPGFGCTTTTTTRPHSGFREYENDVNLQSSQFSKSGDFRIRRQFRHDSVSMRAPHEPKKALQGRIIRSVQTCSQPKQKEGLFSNELGKTMDLSQKAHGEILAKEAKESAEALSKRQRVMDEKEVVGIESSEKPSGCELEGWDHLNQDFKEFVSQTLRRRIQKYQQPEHPLKLRCDEAEALFKKLYDSIICIEENAFGSFARDKIKRHVSKYKLELNIKEPLLKSLEILSHFSLGQKSNHPFYELETFRVEQRVAKEINKRGLDVCLEESHLTSLKKTKGKVRDVYDLGNKLLFVTTDRLSAFDRYLLCCPFKGQVINQTSSWWFNKTAEIVPNAVVATPDPNVLIMKKTKVFPIEFVVRAYMTGTTSTSLWTNYSQGVREYCGHRLPEGLSKNDALLEPMITPTTKSDVHDELISGKEIVDQGLMTLDDWEATCSLALKLFKFGRELASKKDLILVDTKYEFGKDDDGNILLIDEVHTPDSSRFWIQSSYEERKSQGEDPDNFDKEFIRRWYTAQCDPYKTKSLPIIPEKLLLSLASRYVFLYEAMTDIEFVPSEDLDINNRIYENIKNWI
eukprot:g4584.t1